MENLLAHFLSQGVPVGEVNEIMEAFKFKKLGKGDYFVEEGKTSKQIAFVSKGMFQYFYAKDGKEITTYVSGANAFLASLLSFFRQQPSKEYIRALSDAEIWTLHFNDLDKLRKTNQAFRTFYIGALESLAVGMDETRSNLIILTAEERYATMVKHEPALIQQIPLQYLASILAVTPRHLSRIRRNFC